MLQKFAAENVRPGARFTSDRSVFPGLSALGAWVTFALIPVPLLPASPADAPAAQVGDHTLARPEELLKSIARLLKPDWASQFRQLPASAPESRAQIAFAIGSILAEGHLAVHAEDSQHSRNIGKDLLLLAKPVGAHAEMLEHTRSLSDYAEKRNWELLGQELELVAADLGKVLSKNGDSQLAGLIHLGKWVRILEIASIILHTNYSESAARIMQQPTWPLGFSAAHLNAAATIEHDPAISPAQARLHHIQNLLQEQSTSAPTDLQIHALSETAHGVLLDILSKRK
jgi:hypothetical protein